MKAMSVENNNHYFTKVGDNSEVNFAGASEDQKTKESTNQS